MSGGGVGSSSAERRAGAPQRDESPGLPPELPPELTPELEERLSALLDEYFQSLERGQPIDPRELAARHPELAEHLRGYLKSIEFLQGAAVGFRPSGSSESSAGVDPLLSRQLGDFRIVREVGRGGMGVVYEAWQDSLKRRVALKVLPFAALLDAQQVARFRHEAQAAARLQHPHIVPVYAVGTDQGLHFYAMQFIDGVPLDRVVSELKRRGGKRRGAAEAGEELASPLMLPPPFASGRVDSESYVREVAELIAPAADALEAAHESGVIHRDIKPSNLMVGAERHVWVTDFGLARNRGDVELTRPGDFVGTIRYVSPEQAQGPSQLVDARTDVFSLGATLYELLTLHPATRGETSAELLRQLEEGRPYPPRAWNPAIPFDLETIVLKALAYSREDRYGTARELADDLRRFAAGEPIRARRPSLADQALRFARRHRVGVLASAAAVGVLIVGLAATTMTLAWQQQRLERALRSASESFQRYRSQLAASHHHLAMLHEQQGDAGEAERWYRESLRLYREALDESAEGVGQSELRQGYAATLGDLAVLREELDPAEADQLYAEAAVLLAELVRTASDDRNLAAELALNKSNQGAFWSRQGRLDDALQAFADAESILRRLHDSAPSDREISRDWAVTLNNLGMTYQRLKRYDESEKVFRRSAEVLPEEQDGDGRAAADWSRRGGIWNNLGLVLRKLGRTEEAAQAFDEAIVWQNRACQAAPNVDRFRKLLEQHRANREKVDQKDELEPSLGID